MNQLYHNVFLQQEKISGLEIELQNIGQELLMTMENVPSNIACEDSKKQVSSSGQMRAHYKGTIFSFFLSFLCSLPIIPCVSKLVMYSITAICLITTNSLIATYYHRKRMLKTPIFKEDWNEEYMNLKTLYKQITNELSCAKAQLESLKRQIVMDYIKQNPEKIEALIEQKVLEAQMEQYYLNFSTSMRQGEKNYIKQL